MFTIRDCKDNIWLFYNYFVYFGQFSLYFMQSLFEHVIECIFRIRKAQVSIILPYFVYIFESDGVRQVAVIVRNEYQLIVCKIRSMRLYTRPSDLLIMT